MKLLSEVLSASKFSKFSARHYINRCCIIQSRISSNKRPRRLSNFETLTFGAYQRAALIRGGAYFKVREINNIKCQNLLTISFKIRVKQIFTINKPNIMKNVHIDITFIVLLFVY